jgi:hypothetical protein
MEIGVLQLMEEITWTRNGGFRLLHLVTRCTKKYQSIKIIIEILIIFDIIYIILFAFFILLAYFKILFAKLVIQTEETNVSL